MSKVYEKKGLFIGMAGAVGHLLSYSSLLSSDWQYVKNNYGCALMASYTSVNLPVVSSIMRGPACRTSTAPRWVMLDCMMNPEVGLAPQVSLSCWISCSVILVARRFFQPSHPVFVLGCPEFVFSGCPLLGVGVIVCRWFGEGARFIVRVYACSVYNRKC